MVPSNISSESFFYKRNQQKILTKFLNSVTWYVPKRGEVRFNFPSPFVFELTSPATDHWIS